MQVALVAFLERIGHEGSDILWKKGVADQTPFRNWCAVRDGPDHVLSS